MNFAGKSVIVTGGTGSVGTEIIHQLLETEAADIVIFSRDEHKQHEQRQTLDPDPRLRFIIGDIRDPDRVNEAFLGVNYCFHAAALKHVPICEEHPYEAVKTNVIGTYNVIKASLLHCLDKVLAISTDKAVEPISVLGATKLLMERAIKTANMTETKLASIRFGNIINSRGSVIPVWLKQVEAGHPVTVTDPQATRYFITVQEAVKFAFEAMDLTKGGETFVVKNGPAKRIIDLATELKLTKEVPIRVTGLRPGEKLHETLLTPQEANIATNYDGLVVIR